MHTTEMHTTGSDTTGTDTADTRRTTRSTARRVGTSAGLFGVVAVAATGCTPEVDAILTILRILGWFL